MDQDAWIQQLEADGYSHIQAHISSADTQFPEHTHEQATVHVILEGELTTTDAQGTTVYHAGDRFDIPAGTTHEAECGSDGCTFLVGVKE